MTVPLPDDFNLTADGPPTGEPVPPLYAAALVAATLFLVALVGEVAGWW